jgi:hypothetical protein
MTESLLDRIVDKLRNIGSVFKGLVAGAIMTFFMYNFYHEALCSQGALACASMKNLGIIFPFYLVLTSFTHRVTLNGTAYTFLYIISAAAYMIIAWYAMDIIGKAIVRFKNRPRFILKRI